MVKSSLAVMSSRNDCSAPSRSITTTAKSLRCVVVNSTWRWSDISDPRWKVHGSPDSGRLTTKTGTDRGSALSSSSWTRVALVSSVEDVTV